MTRDRALRLLPPLVLGIPLLYFLLDRFDSVTSIIASPRGVVVLIATAVGWVVLSRIVLPRVTRNVFVQSGVMTVVALAIVWFVVAQSYTDKDRKSTRLNSCHSSISYAVFCLKKKIIL